eukprot:tig00020903_g15089.t1
MFKGSVARVSNVAGRRNLNTGIIGAGRIGRVHANTLMGISDVKTVMVSDIVEAAAKKAAADYNIAKATTNWMDIIKNPEIQAVWICSPSDQHTEQIIAAAKAGKHIFCEKPVATDLKGVDEALKVVKECGVELFLAFQRRFDPNFQRVKNAITTGEIGQPISVRLTSRDPAPPPVEYTKQSGGIFKDMQIHDLDMARFLMGCEPTEILAIGKKIVDPRIWNLDAPLSFDTALTLVNFENGATVTIDNCRKAVYGYDQRAEVFGTKGCVITDNLYPNAASSWLEDKIKRDLPLNFFMERYTDAYRNETIAFVEAVKAKKPMPCSGHDGRQALVMAMAAAKSAKEGRFVKISEIGY